MYIYIYKLSLEQIIYSYLRNRVGIKGIHRVDYKIYLDRYNRGSVLQLRRLTCYKTSIAQFKCLFVSLRGRFRPCQLSYYVDIYLYNELKSKPALNYIFLKLIRMLSCIRVTIDVKYRLSLRLYYCNYLLISFIIKSLDSNSKLVLYYNSLDSGSEICFQIGALQL